jgi:hypothetical protein
MKKKATNYVITVIHLNYINTDLLNEVYINHRRKIMKQLTFSLNYSVH